MKNDQPMILTSKDHEACHQRWALFKHHYPDRVPIVYRLFDLAERSVEMEDLEAYIPDIYERAYGHYSPIDTLMEAMFFPPDSPLCNRTYYAEAVHDLILEHETYGGNGLYMPRSVVLGWIAQQHDTVLRMAEEGDE